MAEVVLKKVPVNAIQDLRHKVLWPHLESPEKCVIDPDTDETTFHMAALIDDKVVGTSTLIIDINNKFAEKNQYRLRAMATDPDVRGLGLGAKIIDAVIAELKNKNVKLLWCDARLIATGFYEKQNFRVLGGVYDVPKIGPHKLMYIEL